MKKEELLQTIKKERKEGNDFVKADLGRYYAMKFDKSDGAFWVDCFENGSSFKRYKSDSIITIHLEDVVKSEYSEDKICESIFRYCLRVVDIEALEDFPKTIKDYRERAGISKAKMSRTFEIPIRTLENWESGVNQPSPWVEKLIIEKLISITAEP